MPSTLEVVENSKPFPLIAICGPTGAGKSEFAFRVAAEFPAEIVNCDSLQIYRYFDIGTAKPSASERNAVRHHLVDVADPCQVYTAGDYVRDARRALHEIALRGRLPLVVGGTGFYLKALLEGLFRGPQRSPELRERLRRRESQRPGTIHRLLRRLDPGSAARIHERDLQKSMRALEVCLLTRQPMTALIEEGRERLEDFGVLKIGLNPPRPELYRRLDERAERMFEAGLVLEAEGILRMGYTRAAKPFESLGYRQALQILKGECTLAEAIASTQQETRRYAKRQWTWFRRDPQIRWLDGFGGETKVQEGGLSMVQELCQGC